MIIYCENDGKTTTAPSSLPFGSALREITIIAPQKSTSVVMKIKPPNGEYLPDVVCAPFISKENVVLFSVKLPKAVANKAGRVDYQLFFNTSDGEVIPTFGGSFNVSKGVPSDMPGSVEQLGELSIENLYEVLSRCTEIALMTTNLNEFVGIDKELQTANKNLAEAINELKNALAAHNVSPEAHEDIRREIKEIAEQIESGGGSGGVNLELDTTLTVEGKAADAKAVGDRFGEYIDDVDALIGGEGTEGGGSTGGGSYVLELTAESGTLTDEQYNAVVANAPNVVIAFGAMRIPLVSDFEGEDFVFAINQIDSGYVTSIGAAVSADKSYNISIVEDEYATKTYVDNAVANAGGGGDGGRTLKALEFTSLESLYDSAIALENPIFYDIGLDGDEYIQITLPTDTGGTVTSTIDAVRFQVKLVYDGAFMAAQAVTAKGIVTIMFGRMEGEFVSMDILSSFDGSEQEGTINVGNVTKFNLYYF